MIWRQVPLKVENQNIGSAVIGSSFFAICSAMPWILYSMWEYPEVSQFVLVKNVLVLLIFRSGIRDFGSIQNFCVFPEEKLLKISLSWSLYRWDAWVVLGSWHRSTFTYTQTLKFLCCTIHIMRSVMCSEIH